MREVLFCRCMACCRSSISADIAEQTSACISGRSSTLLSASAPNPAPSAIQNLLSYSRTGQQCFVDGIAQQMAKATRHSSS